VAKYGFMQLPSAPPLDWTESYPLWTRMNIETHSRCNRRCRFCPQYHGRREGDVVMRKPLFTTICDELKTLGFAGVIEMFLLDEPLINPEYAWFIETARAFLPRVTLYTSTNADVLLALDEDKAIARLNALYTRGLNVVNLNVYDRGEDRLLTTEKFMDAVVAAGVAEETSYAGKYRKHSPKKRLITITDMRLERDTCSVTASVNNRSTEDRKTRLAHRWFCARPMRHLVVRYDGLVPICCVVDATDDDSVYAGDANDQSLHSIWNSKVYAIYRYFLQSKRRVLPECDTCNHKHAFMHVHRKIRVPNEVAVGWEEKLRAYEAGDKRAFTGVIP